MMEKVFDLADLVEYQEGAIVSRALIQKETGSITLFALSSGESISEHTSPYQAFLLMIEGVCDVKIGENLHRLDKGKGIIMPAHVPHSLHAVEPAKFLLVMVK